MPLAEEPLPCVVPSKVIFPPPELMELLLKMPNSVRLFPVKKISPPCDRTTPSELIPLAESPVPVLDPLKVIFPLPELIVLVPLLMMPT
jgi:hypothetical protein